MPFHITYYDLVNRNLKNIYGSEKKTDKITRSLNNSPERSPKLPKLLKRSSSLPRRDNLEYLPEYGAFLPRAPAFREYTGAKIREIVDRMAKSNRRTDEDVSQKEKDKVNRHRKGPVVVSPRARSVSFKLANKATVASSIRRRLSERNARNARIYPDIKLTCSRFERTVIRNSPSFEESPPESYTIEDSDDDGTEEEDEDDDDDDDDVTEDDDEILSIEDET